jgi:hypothetical protein
MGPKRGNLDVVFVALVVLPLLYVLSLGPVAKLHSVLHVGPTRAALTFYAPLIWCAEKSDAAEKALEKYLALWGTK